MEIPPSVVAEGVALALVRLLGEGAGAEKLASLVAEKVCGHLEPLTPKQTAELLGVSTRRLQQRATAWGLNKSVAMGATNPRYFLSEVIVALKARQVRGSRQPLAVVERRAA